MLRLVSLCALLVCVLVLAGEALADAPVFVVVRTGGGAPQSLQYALRQQLARDRRALLGFRHAHDLRVGRLRRLQAGAVNATDPFPAEDAAARLQRAIAADAGRAHRLTRAIRGLQLALQPVELPAGFSSRPPSAIGAYAVSVAERYLGVRYLWGGGDPSSGFDCSGFVKYVYAQLGVQLPHYAATQYAATMHIEPSQLEPGDLVFFEPHSDGPGHVGIYVGNDVFIEAPHTGDVVKFAQLSTEASLMGFVGASRPAA